MWRNIYESLFAPGVRQNLKIFYEVSKIDPGRILRILRILENSGDSLGIHGDSGDSKEFQRILEDSCSLCGVD